MKVLYAIQGTGNGHLSRAMEVIPHLQKHVDLDILVSGTQVDLNLAQSIKYRYQGLSFIFGKKGGIDIINTYLKSNSYRLLREIKSLPVENYDLIINDFEPVSAWAAHFKKVPCYALSNQCAALSPNAPKPKTKDPLGKLILEKYAPATACYGFHFIRFDDNIFTPIIRKEIRELVVTNEGHYTVYLPAYDDERILKHLSKFPEVKWEVFSKHNKYGFTERNISVKPIQQDAFLKSLASCEGVLSAAGFGTTAEALFLNKKLLVIPMKSQYEQHCNAAVLKSMDVPVMKSLKSKHINVLEEWLQNGKAVEVNYPDNTAEIVEKILGDFQKTSTIHKLKNIR
ncbi:MAG: glycosyl transferase [Sphingobacteriales bacterium]|nr:MAG: glycosyl transferase [Sphingobacteriales bacterium]